jgi:hypothetical protein
LRLWEWDEIFFFFLAGELKGGGGEDKASGRGEDRDDGRGEFFSSEKGIELVETGISP